MEKSVTFLYICNNLSEKEIKKPIPFTIASKRIKYLGISFIKKVQELYTKNYKILLK